MNTQRISSFSFLIHLPLTIKFLILFQLAHNGSSGPSEFYQTCGNTFSCGESITGIGYPFRGFYDPPYCGHPNFVLTCDSEQNITNIDIMGARYRVLEIDEPTQTMMVSREDIMEATCPTQMTNTTLDYSIFDFATVYWNFTFLYGCPGKVFIPDAHPISCGNNIGEFDGTYVVGGTFGPGNCKDSVTVPAPVPGNNVFPNATELDRILRQGFQIRWKIGSQACINCTASKGRCGYDLETNRTACYCPGPPYVSDTCPVANVNSTGMTPSPVKGTYVIFLFLDEVKNEINIRANPFDQDNSYKC